MTGQRRRRLYLFCQVAGWGIHGLINCGFALFSGPLTLSGAAMIAWTETLAGFLSHLLRAWIHRRGWLGLPLVRVFPRVFAASLVCGLAVVGVNSVILVFLLHANRRPDWNWLYVLPIWFLWSVVTFLWATVYFAVHYFESYQDARVEQFRLAVAAKDSELRSLLSQVNPHFIFNCLNSLRALIAEDPRRAQNMVDELSSILRYSLRSGNVKTVTLAEEVEAIEAYLKLEIIRFEDRLRVSMDIDPASLPAQVPPMLVQTLVENGVKHGISRLKQGGEVKVVSRVEGGSLKIQVTNSGQLLPAAAGATQIGIDNARERLRLIYGAAASLVLRNLDTRSVFAEVLLPFKRADL